jgi:hypothetical protein
LETLGDRIVPAKFWIHDAQIIEGNAGTQYALVSVGLDANGKRDIHSASVNYATADGSATAGSDYGAVSGTLTFARGETRKTIAVPIYGDRLGEGYEAFRVNLSGPQRAQIADGQAVVTIDDNEPRIGIPDAFNNAEATFTFTVSLDRTYDEAVTVNFATADGTAIAGVDYVATSGTLTFAPGENTKTITVEALDPTVSDKSFLVQLSLTSTNAAIVYYDAASGRWAWGDEGWGYGYFDYDGRGWEG